MIQSGQISQMFAQQNQMFAGNAMYSQQISQQMPGMYASSYGGQGFSYGGQAPMGYDFASRASGGIMSGMGGAAQLGLGVGSVMAGLGFGGAARYALDPFAGAGAMYRMGGSMGMGMGGRLGMGAMGMLPAAGIMAGASHMIGSTIAGAQEQSGIERVLGQNFNFANSGTGGRGFSRQQGMAIGDMVRQLEHMPEMMTSMGELTRIMDRMGQMGIMNGVTNVREFGTKFKGTLNVLKEMSKVIGSTMEEALPLFGEIRRSGMYSTSDILKNAMQRQVVGGLTGMNQGQVGQTAAYGAQLGFATGGSRATGAQHALRMAGQLGMANQMGVLSNDQIMELTGQEGAAGIQALSGQLTQAGYRMSGSALGTAMSIAMAETKGGQFTGKMDKDLMEQFRSGSISKSQMLQMLHQKTASRGAKMSYVTHRGQLRSEMAGQMGVEGQMNMLQMILGERGYDNPDALNIVSQGFGLDEREAGLLVELGRKMPDINTEMRQRGRAESKRIAQDAFMKQNYSWDAVKSKVSKRIEGVITEPFKQFGADLRNSIANVVDDFVDDITGKYKVEVTRGMSSLIQGAGTNLGDSRKRLAQIVTGGGGAALGRGVDMTPGMMGSAMNWLTGSGTSGERMADIMRDTVGGGGGAGYRNIDTSLGGLMKGGGAGMRDLMSMQDRGFNRLDGGRFATSEAMQSTARYLSQLSQGTVMTDGSVADQAHMKSMLGDPNFAAARAQFSATTSGSGNRLGGLALQEMNWRYGGQDVLGAIGQDVQGRGAGFAMEARRKLRENAGFLSLTPDKGVEAAGRIKSFERGRLQRMFGAQDADAVQGLLKDSSVGDYTASALLGQASGKHAELGGGGIFSGNLLEQAQRAAHAQVSDNLQAIARREYFGDELSGRDREAINRNRETYEATKKVVEIEDVVAMAKNGGNFTDQQKKVLAKMGYPDSSKFTREEAEKVGKAISAINKHYLSDDDRRQLAAYRGDLGKAGLIEISQRISAQGRDVAGRAASLRKAGIPLGKEGAAMLGRIEAYAGKMAGMTTEAGLLAGFGTDAAGKRAGTSFAEDMGSVAYDLTQMKDQKLARQLVAADDDLGAAYAQASSTQRRLRSSRKFDSFFDTEAAVRKGGAAVEQLGEVRKQFFDEKGNLRQGMEKDFIKFQASDRGQQLMTAAGTEQRSKYASQADIAKNMESFGQSVASLAQIVQTMKDGKTAEGGTK